MEFRLLGPLQVVIGERRVGLGPYRQRLLLAVLLCHPGNRVSTTSLINALWGCNPPASAADNVYLYVYRLRGALGAARITGRDGYVLNAAPEEIDVHRFDQLAHSGRQALAAGDPHMASAELHQALRLWRGSAFADFDDHAAFTVRAAYLDDRRLTVLEHRIDADLALGRHADVADELAMLIRQHPYRERFHAQRMLALYRSGRQADALVAYHTLRSTLAEELGVDPWPNVQRIHLAILRSDSVLDLNTAPAAI